MKKLVLAILLFCCVFHSNAKLKVAGIFGDNVVIQQEIAAPVWGRTREGETVRVQIAGYEVKTIADKNGAWMVRLIQMKADGKQYELVVSSGNEKIIWKNIEIGEVWFASGK